jgi:hypothetical protein
VAIQKLIELAGGIEKPYVICGDFNACPDTATYQFVSSGHLNSDSVKELQAIDEVEQNTEQVFYILTGNSRFAFPSEQYARIKKMVNDHGHSRTSTIFAGIETKISNFYHESSKSSTKQHNRNHPKYAPPS